MASRKREPRQVKAVSVPPDLKSRMVAEKSVNWSAVAIEAFREILGRKLAKRFITRKRKSANKCQVFTLSVPAEFKRQMRAVDGTVNWSAVAVEAFRKELALIERERAAEARKRKAKK